MSRTLVYSGLPSWQTGLPASVVSPIGPPFSYEPVSIRSGENICGPITVRDEDIFCMRQKIAQAQRKLEEVMANRAGADVPEVFDLPPLSRKRVTIKVRRVVRASFNYVTDDPLLDD